jgi:Spy/CpxP family protein refolding chaperone
MKNHNKAWIIFSFLVVFAAGIFGGILLENKVLDKKSKKTSHLSRRSSAHFPTLNEMAAELDLTNDQREQIKEIFNKNEIRLKELRGSIHKQFSTLRTQLLTEVKSVLKQDQVQKFEAMIERYLSQRREAIEKRRKRSNKTKGEEK